MTKLQEKKLIVDVLAELEEHIFYRISRVEDNLVYYSELDTLDDYDKKEKEKLESQIQAYNKVSAMLEKLI